MAHGYSPKRFEKRDEKTERPERSSKDLHVSFTAADKLRLRSHIKEELEFYNLLVSTLSARFNAFPDTFLQFGEDHFNLFATLAKHGLTLQDARKSQAKDLIPFAKFLSGDGQLNEAIAITFECVANRAALISAVRGNMAYELLRFFAKQAEIKNQKLPQSLMEDNAYRSSFKLPVIQDANCKRHLQIPRSCVNMTWSEKLNASEVKIPYLAEKFLIRDVNITDTDMKRWNYMIIHQTGEEMPSSSTPWIVTLKNVDARYMIHYLDQRNPYAGVSFYVAKRR